MQNETIHGTYTFVKMPDGSEQLMHQLANGKWALTEERVKSEESQAFENRFKDEEMAPHDLYSVRTHVLSICPDKLRVSHGKTLSHIHAYLLEILGDPARLMEEKQVPKNIEYGIRRHILGLIDIEGVSPTWKQVGNLLREKW